MTYLDQLKAHIVQKGIGDELPKLPQHRIGGYGSYGDRDIAGINLLATWHRELSRLETTDRLHRLPAGRWRQLIDDAMWLFENYGCQAARLGWTSADLFGVQPGKDGWGGIADRLQSSRSLVVDAERAVWRHFGVPMTFNRGAYPDLKTLWEVH